MKLVRAVLALALAASTAVVATSGVATAAAHVCEVGDPNTSPEPASVIQVALDNAACEVVEVAPGTYEGNLVIARTVELVSTGGRDVTIIDGDDAAAGLGTVQVNGGLTGVAIGGAGAGFTVQGIDGPPGIEHAAVYLLDAQTGIKISGNDLVARGDAALLSEFGATVAGLVVDGNIFSGQTFTGTEPAGVGFGDQFTLANVPRQLVTLGGGDGGGNTSDVTFTNNQIMGVAGGTNPDGFPQGNTLVTVDAVGATITGNTFAGTTSRFATSLRARGPATTISDNTFDSSGLETIANGHVFVKNTGQSVADVAAANTFDLGVYVDGAIGTIGISIEAAVGAAPAGSVIDVLPGTYVEGSPQVEIDRDLELRGADRDTTIVTPGGDTAANGNARGWFLVTPGTDLDVSGMTFDGDGTLVWQAFRHLGTGSFDDTAFRNILFNPSTSYAGTAVAAFGAVGAVDVANSTFENIGRIGVHYFGPGTTGTYSGNTYTGKGDGNFIDNALDIGAGAEVIITDSTISGNTGVAASDGSSSTGVLLSTFSGVGTSAVIDGLTVTDSTTGVSVGFDDSDGSELVIRNSSVTGNYFGIQVVSGTALVETTDLTGNEFAGIYVSGGAVVDAGQVAPGTAFTGLGVSLGGNDFSSYDDTTRSVGAPGAAIVNANTNVPNSSPGPQGPPHDLTAQRNVFAMAGSGDIEAVIDHDADDLLRGFVDASSPVLPAPTAVTAVAGVVSAELSWTAPASGDEPIGYRIESSVDNGLSWATRVADTGSAATTATVTGLAGDTPTRFRVTALDAGGPSLVSEPSDAVTPAWRDRIGFDSIPTPFPNSLPSIGFQARSTSEFGDRIQFDAVSDTLEIATVTMVNWAYLSAWEADGYTAGGYEHPITLNLYEVDLDGEPGAVIASVTQDVFIEWRPESPASCTTGWGATCSNGYAFPVEFDLTGVEVPDEVIFGIAYNTQSHGYDPIGISGPYDSLNVGLLDLVVTPDGVSVGTDVDPATLYQNSTWAGAYEDGGTTGSFRGDSAPVWERYTPAVQFTFAAVVPDAPAAPVAVAGVESADVSWDAPVFDGGSAVIGYLVEVSDDGGATWSVAIADTGSTATSATVAPLVAGTPVVFRVSAINAVGESDPSPASNEVTPTAVVPPVEPPVVPPVDPPPIDPDSPVFVAVDPVRFFDSRTLGAPVAAGSTRSVSVTGVQSVPSGVPAVVVNITATRAAGAGFVSGIPCGSTEVPTTSNLNYQADRDVAILAVLPVDADGNVCLYTSADVDLVLDVIGYAPADGGYATVEPLRLADTRAGDGIPAGGSVIEVTPPESDAEMLALSVTTTMATADGFFTVWACGNDEARPETSALNFQAGRDAANVTVVPNDTICVFTSAESHMIVDLQGLIGPSIAVESERLVDTRVGGERLTAGEIIEIDPAELGLSEGTTFALMNFTAVEPEGPGFLTVRPCADTDTESSTLNVVPGTAVANFALVDTAGSICVLASTDTHVLVDLVAAG